MSENVLIIGGGLSGLVAGYRLSFNKNLKVTILEKEKNLGGLAASFEKNGEVFPLAYHHIMPSDTNVLSLIKELGLERKFFTKKTKIRFMWQNKFFPLKSPIDILLFKPLSFKSRIKLAILGLKSLLIKDWALYDNISAKDWIIKSAGIELYEKVFSPLLESKFSSDATKISASWIGYRLASRESKGNFGYLRGGISLIIKKLEETIIKNGGDIIKEAKLNKISITKSSATQVGYKIKNKKFVIKTDSIISTIPTPLFLSSLKKKDEEIFSYLRKIKYKSAISCIVALDKKVTPFYWINLINSEKNALSFKAIFDHSSLNPYVNGGNSVLYLITYLDKNDSFYKKRDEEIFNRYMDDLEKIFPGVKKIVKWHKIFKLSYSKPVYFTGYRKICPSMVTPVKNLYLSGIFLFPEMRNMGAAIGYGIKVSNLVKNESDKRSL